MLKKRTKKLKKYMGADSYRQTQPRLNERSRAGMLNKAVY
jgi:hypothetical protein